MYICVHTSMYIYTYMKLHVNSSIYAPQSVLLRFRPFMHTHLRVSLGIGWGFKYILVRALIHTHT